MSRAQFEQRRRTRMRPNMRHLIALLLMTLAASGAAAADQLDDYPTAGSEDIYLQPNSEYDAEEELDEYTDQDLDTSVEKQQESKPGNSNNNIEALGEDELSCEYSCPRYYRPVCVSRNDQLVTYATPCEFFNQLRCANVAKRQGKDTPTFQLLYHNACKQNTH